MAGEVGMGHVGLELVHSDLSHFLLARQLEAVLDVSLSALSRSQDLNA